MAVVNVGDYFDIEGSDYSWQRKQDSISRVEKNITLDPAVQRQMLTSQDVDSMWRNTLDVGANRYNQFYNEYTNQKVLKDEIASYLGTTPSGSLPTRSQEQAGYVQGLGSGSAMETAAKQASGELPVPGDPYYQNSRQQGQPPPQQQQQGQQQQQQSVAPSFQQVLGQVYSTRPDLQAVYNPDGSAKNINDPRVAGIPTLEDWGRKFGVNESPMIKQALSAPSGGGSGLPSGSGGSTSGGSQQGSGAPAGDLDKAAVASSFKQTYSDVYGQLGLNNVKKEYESYNKQILDLRNKLTDEKSDIDSNPWYSEGIRVIEQRKLDAKYETKLANLTAFLSLTNNLYQEGLEQARFLTTGIYEESEQRRQENLARVEADQAANATLVENYNVTTPFYNNRGLFVRASDGKKYSTPEEFFKDAGVTSFQQAKDMGLYTDLDANKAMDRAAVLDLRSQFPDAGIQATDTYDQASAKLGRSRIYQDSVRGPVGSGGGSSAGVLGLTNQQIDNISPLVTQFQNSPIVQKYNTIGEAYKFVQGLSNTTTNPSDDQALIYAFAKAQDPDSVVREGEYATVQKYSQSLVQAYGKSVTQAINGTGILSTEARQNMKNTIASRFQAVESSYNNLYGETARRIDLIGGTDKGSALLNNYGGAFQQPSVNTSNFVGPQQYVQPQEAPPVQNFWDKALNWLTQ